MRRMQVAESVMPDGQETATSAGRTTAFTSSDSSGTGPQPCRSLVSRTDRPAVAGLIALLAALGFVLARWQTWAHGNIGRFILVGHHCICDGQSGLTLLRECLSAYDEPEKDLGTYDALGAIEDVVPAALLEDRSFRRRMRWKIAEMYRDIEASRSILYRACASADPFPDPLLAAAAKVTVNEMALRVTSEAIQVHGGYGFTDEFPVSRFYRGARYGTLGGGTSETLRDLMGKRVLAGVDPVDGIFGLGAF